MRIRFLWSMLLLMAFIIDLHAKDTFIRMESQIIEEAGAVHFDPQRDGERDVTLSACGKYLMVEREGNYKITGEVQLVELPSPHGGVKGNFELVGTEFFYDHPLFKPIRVRSDQGPMLKTFKINKLFLAKGTYKVSNNFRGPFTPVRILISGRTLEDQAFKITFQKLLDE